ncbi:MULTISPECIES: hypothetical protein [unclassified Curtobacterium]|uniref:hypothetical protein n=1 Tax=unclassified Curtobacterium TaxID=257496 RepID=UPI001C651793|nr:MULTISPECIES: hypothetical protein [unclassified Curtobacterium]
MSTSTEPLLPRARPTDPGGLDRLGTPRPLAAGLLGVLVAGCSFGCSLAGFVPMGAIRPALAPRHRGAAVTWTFVGLYACAFVLVGRLRVPPAPTTDAQP